MRRIIDILRDEGSYAEYSYLQQWLAQLPAWPPMGEKKLPLGGDEEEKELPLGGDEEEKELPPGGDEEEEAEEEEWEKEQVYGSWEDVPSELQQELQDLLVGIVSFYQLPVMSAVHKYLLSLTMHTEAHDVVQDPERRSRVDLKAWSHQGVNLRSLAPLDAGNNAYGRLWGIIVALAKAIPFASDGPTQHQGFADMIMQACSRFESLAHANIIKAVTMYLPNK